MDVRKRRKCFLEFSGRDLNKRIAKQRTDDHYDILDGKLKSETRKCFTSISQNMQVCALKFQFPILREFSYDVYVWKSRRSFQILFHIA